MVGWCWQCKRKCQEFPKFTNQPIKHNWKKRMNQLEWFLWKTWLWINSIYQHGNFITNFSSRFFPFLLSYSLLLMLLFFRSFHRVNLIWKIECFRIRWISHKSWFTSQSENIRFLATGKSFTINIMWAVVITMLSNSANQNLLEISHLNYGRSLVAVSRIRETWWWINVTFTTIIELWFVCERDRPGNFCLI